MTRRQFNSTALVLSFVFCFVGSVRGQDALSRLQEVIKQNAENELALSKADIVIEFPNLDPAELDIAAVDDLSLLPRNRIRTGSQIVRIGVFRAGQLREKLVLRVVLRTFQTVLTAKHDLSRHAVIHHDDVTSVRRETTRLRESAFSSLDAIVGTRTQRYVQRGEMLTEHVLEPIPVVERGEEVNMHFMKENLEIVLPGKAREDGLVGDEIRVKCLETGKSFEAEIIDKKTVHITLL